MRFSESPGDGAFPGASAASRPPLGAVGALSWLEAWQLLSGVGFGRVVFTRDGLPAVQLVKHVLDDDQIIARIELGPRRGRRGDVVAYQADDVDPDTLAGWSVVVTGLAQTVTDPARLDRFRQALPPGPGAASPVVAITPELVVGHYLPHRATNERPAD